MARIAHECDNITDILLVNSTQKLGSNAILDGLKKGKAKVTIVFGEKDPSVSRSEPLQDDVHAVVVLEERVFYNFSGDFPTLYIGLHMEYLL